MEKDNKKVYTIDDVARELGVSKTTVSRAISGKGRIGEETRKRVLRYIEECDYRPNAVARGLAQRKTYNLALVLPVDYAATEFPFFKDCMNGICEVASAKNYDIIISMAGRDDVSQIQRLVANRKVDGIIMSRSIVSSVVQKYLKENKVPFVVIGSSSDQDVVTVDNKNLEASEELTSILLMKGNHRLAILGGDQSFHVTRTRYQGFEDAHRKAGLEVNPELVFMDVDNQTRAAEAVEAAGKAGADGILCMDDVICGMVMSVLRERKIRVPEEMKLASLYDSRNLEYSIPSVTSVRFDTVRLGKMACVKLLMLLGEDMEEDPLPLNYQVILRESTQ